MSSDVDKEILDQMIALEISTKKLVNNLFTGSYTSAFRGQGMEFSDVREYVHGDDIRHISWPLAARTGKPYVKKYDEERDLAIILAIDASGSVNYGSSELKNHTIAKIAALLGFSAIKGGDKLGMLLFSDVIEEFIQPKKDKKNIYRILKSILKTSSKKTNLKLALRELINIKKRSVVFIISDFMDKNFETELTLLAKKHDAIAIRVLDKSEMELPNIGFINIQDSETKEYLTLNTMNKSKQKTYKANMEHHLKEQTNMINRSKIDLIDITTSQDFFLPIALYFKRRNRR